MTQLFRQDHSGILKIGNKGRCNRRARIGLQGR